MRTIKSLLVFLFIITLAQVSMGQIAITEFVNDPIGDDTDSGREYVEFFNYSGADVDIMNWVLKDEDSDSLLITTTSTIIPSGGFLLYASGKSVIETEWFGGVSDDRIIEYGGPNSDNMQLSNSGDELVLLDSAGDTVWALAYTNDDLWDTTGGTSDDGFNTYLSYYTDFTTHPSRWGTKLEPGIVRNGFDAGISRLDTTATGADTTIVDSVLGYEGGAFTVDDFARLSLNGDSGSPLGGYYTQVSGKLRSNVKVAITEFLNDPLGADTDMGREYVELFNYGTEAVNIQNWTIKDEDHHTLGGNDWLVMTTDRVIIPAGGYLLYASLKDTIEAEYFGGVADSRIIEYGGPSAVSMQLSNSGDELMLLDAVGDTVWNMAYNNDDAYDGTKDDGFSTYLDYATDFSNPITDWGHKGQGIVRAGPDTSVAGAPLGYEGGAFTMDPHLIVSLNGDMGSPLTGSYLALSVDVAATLPGKFALNQNYPNPFNPTTNISYNLGINADVTISIFNILGQHVATLVHQQQKVGFHSVKWDALTNSGKLVSTGIYFCQINARSGSTNYSNVIKMVYMK